MEAARRYLYDVERRLQEARDRAHPGHNGHHCEEKDVQYFDAMMISVTVDCSCGAVLEIDRDHFGK